MGNWDSGTRNELIHLYVENDIPSDELIKDQAKLEALAATLNARVSPNSFSPKEIADELLRIRKGGNLPRIRN